MNATTVLNKSGSIALNDMRSEKLRPCHRERLAVVYVRQSTAQQVLEHQESTRLQYGLVSRAQTLGWVADRVLVIDDDLGKSGTTTQGRAGFQRLVSEVSLDQRPDYLWDRDVALGALEQRLASTLGTLRAFPYVDC